MDGCETLSQIIAFVVIAAAAGFIFFAIVVAFVVPQQWQDKSLYRKQGT